MIDLEKDVFIFGNWKMSQDLRGFQEFVAAWPTMESEFSASGNWSKIEAAIFPSFIQIPALRAFRLKSLMIGAQDCSSEAHGAFTGEVSASSLAEFGAQGVLVGHSERRERASETPESLLSKLKNAIEANLQIVYCVGESELEREQGKIFEVLKDQLAVLDKILPASILIAYEPIWAIGTGKTPTLAQIKEVHQWIQQSYPNNPILYGGSVKPENAREILGVSGVRGLLVGGASLQKESFKSLLECALDYLDSKFGRSKAVEKPEGKDKNSKVKKD